MQRFSIIHLFSTPYHPQTNGLVERFNRTLMESISKLPNATEDWDKFIAPTLFAYRTSKHPTTKIEPFFLVYGRSAVLPIDHFTNDDLDQQTNTLSHRIKHLIENVPQIRLQAQEVVIRSQAKQKHRFDHKVTKPISFQIGDQVLYFNAAKAKQWSGKLDPKWKGPYYIHQVLPHGAYKIRTIEGNVLVTPVNGNLLKTYHDRHDWEPIIYI
jgi:hypothetical protein